ncbi:molecular chaperone DnaJ [Candidatus Falkowbacteria bacterium CG10_big_fil_rev_8_21_14_0_10_44_15]|uniref:Chaperone protein DnaJ n=1 Tax=Candidatus Falkowbacteria bacterium CG10_big_fil_rev_8_21_14_0_10_44_15 TaxID=1974569 RepID=A0A2H0V2B9_9BACT|nr:MAG: molecular chaperone DnaJ [Candidatus Falkowbacteria bacterium CG10_big_fil_rev_8_21_14_0_10_44_15]
MMSKDYYKVLGVDKSSSQEEIKKAFRKKAHEFHPDKAGGNAEKFKEINEAYQILGTEQKRKQYDQFGDAVFQGQGFGGTGMSWEDFMRAASAQGGQAGFGGGGVQFDFGDIGDIFGNIGEMFGFDFGGDSRRRRRRRGADIQTELTIEFAEAVFGTTKDISLYKTVICAHCSGNGAEPGTAIETCATCKGAGYVTQAQRTILGTFQAQSTCPDCGGEGKKASKKCSRCGGNGLQKDKVNLQIKIPAGIDNGQTIRLNGQGEAAVNGGAAGDLYIRIKVKPDKNFVRAGDDILSTAEISIAQAALGDKIPVLTVDGELTLKIPAGTQSGTVFKLRGRGSYSLNSRNRGDQLVTLKVKIPERLSRGERRLFEELRKLED